jgi:hypothetical protein
MSQYTCIGHMAKSDPVQGYCFYGLYINVGSLSLITSLDSLVRITSLFSEYTGEVTIGG